MALNLSVSQFFGKNILLLSPQTNRLEKIREQSLTEKSKLGSGANSDSKEYLLSNQNINPKSHIFSCVKICPFAQF